MVCFLVQGEGVRGLSNVVNTGSVRSLLELEFWGSIGPALCRIFVVKGNLFAQFAHFIFPKCCFGIFGAASPE